MVDTIVFGTNPETIVVTIGQRYHIFIHVMSCWHSDLVHLEFVLLMTIQRHAPLMVSDNHQVFLLVEIDMLYMTVMQVVLLTGCGIQVLNQLTVLLILVDTVVRCPHQHMSIRHRGDINNHRLHHIKNIPLPPAQVVTVAMQTIGEEHVASAIATYKRTIIIGGFGSRSNLPHLFLTQRYRVDILGGHHQCLMLVRRNLHNIPCRLR